MIRSLAVPVLPLLSLALLAAHALRAGDRGLSLALLGLGALIFSRRSWLRPVLACVLLWGCVVWAGTGADLVRLRAATGEPWLRLVLILGPVLALTALSTALVLSARGREFLHRAAPNDAARAAAFLATAGLLLTARAMSPLPILLADRFLPGSGPLEILGLALYAAWLCGRLLDARDTARLRLRLWLGFSIVFFGQLLLGLLVSESFLMTGRLHLPVPALIVAGPIFRGGGLFMPILFGVTLLLVGPAWCSHLCYIGAWDGLAASRARLSPAELARVQERAARWALPARLSTLLLVCGAALGLRLLGASWLLAAWGAALFGLAGVGVMIILSRRAGIMLHCLTWCPMGLVANLLGRINPLRVRMDASCTRCGACARRCRYAALTPGDIDKGRPGPTCTLCGDCLGACAHGSLGYRFPGLSAASARTLFLTAAVSLHAVFLGVARI